VEAVNVVGRADMTPAVRAHAVSGAVAENEQLFLE
jgi:hypothetical protein